MATLLQTNTACTRPTSTSQFCVETQTTEPSDPWQSHEHHPVLYHVPVMGQNLGEHTEPLPPSKGITSESLSPDPGQASSVSATWAQVPLGLPLPR